MTMTDAVGCDEGFASGFFFLPFPLHILSALIPMESRVWEGTVAVLSTNFV